MLMDEIGMDKDEDVIEVGKQIGDFRVVGKLAGGSYRALEFAVTRRAVLHVGGPSIELAQGEMAGIEALDHPGVARVIAHGSTDDDRPWLAAELVNGIALYGAISQRKMAAAELLHLIRYTAAVLAAAHRAGIVHRALTIRSLTLVTNPREYPVAVGDWGIRYRTANVFTAPEANGDGRVDVYALGVIAYRAATGVFPRGALSADAVANMANDAIAIPGAPSGLSTLIARMLAADPESRPTALEVVALARELIGAETGDVVADAITEARKVASEPPELLSFADDIVYTPTPRFARPKWTPAPSSYPRASTSQPDPEEPVDEQKPETD